MVKPEPTDYTKEVVRDADELRQEASDYLAVLFARKALEPGSRGMGVTTVAIKMLIDEWQIKLDLIVKKLEETGKQKRNYDQN